LLLRWKPIRPALIWLGTRWPKQGFALASLLDQLAGRLDLCQPTFFRRGMVYLGVAHPTHRSPYPHMICSSDPEAIRPPAILVGTHFGAVEAVGALLERLPGEVATSNAPDH
jgi:hypothetical protein